MITYARLSKRLTRGLRVAAIASACAAAAQKLRWRRSKISTSARLSRFVLKIFSLHWLKRAIRRTHSQRRLSTARPRLYSILRHDLTFGIGPAGTGKTFLAVACAIDALEREQVKRIVLTRPAVEAGERLGFLPGDLAQKVDPYLRPL